MKYRPWPILILALLHIAAPLFSFLQYNLLLNMSLDNYVAAHLSSVQNMFSLFLLPTVGVVIYLFKKWSLPVFIILEIIIVIINASNVILAVGISPTYVLVLQSCLYTLNILIVSYFLSPPVREFYVDIKQHWWENKERFFLETTCDFISLDDIGKPNINTSTGLIKNISETGLLIESNVFVEHNSILQLKFSYKNLSFNISIIVKTHPNNKDQVFGAEFYKLTHFEQNNINKIVASLTVMELCTDRDKLTAYSSFKDWIRTLVKTGKGFFPNSKSIDLG